MLELNGQQFDESPGSIAGQLNGYFDRLHRRLLGDGQQSHEARRAVFEAYLDGKRQATGRRRPTRADRDRWFSSNAFVGGCSSSD